MFCAFVLILSHVGLLMGDAEPGGKMPAGGNRPGNLGNMTAPRGDETYIRHHSEAPKTKQYAEEKGYGPDVPIFNHTTGPPVVHYPTKWTPPDPTATTPVVKDAEPGGVFHEGVFPAGGNRPGNLGNMTAPRGNESYIRHHTEAPSTKLYMEEKGFGPGMPISNRSTDPPVVHYRTKWTTPDVTGTYPLPNRRVTLLFPGRNINPPRVPHKGSPQSLPDDYQVHVRLPPVLRPTDVMLDFRKSNILPMDEFDYYKIPIWGQYETSYTPKWRPTNDVAIDPAKTDGFEDLMSNGLVKHKEYMYFVYRVYGKLVDKKKDDYNLKDDSKYPLKQITVALN